MMTSFVALLIGLLIAGFLLYLLRLLPGVDETIKGLIRVLIIIGAIIYTAVIIIPMLLSLTK